MAKQVQEAYIVAATRTPIGRSHRGFFRNMRPDDLLATTLKAALAAAPGLDPAAIEDIICGCAIPEAQQGLNVARIGAVLALLAVMNAVLVVAAIYIWKTASHPGPIFVQKGGSGLKEPLMKKAFWLSFSAFTLLFISILVAKFRTEQAESHAHGFDA